MSYSDSFKTKLFRECCVDIHQCQTGNEVVLEATYGATLARHRGKAVSNASATFIYTSKLKQPQLLKQLYRFN